MARWRRIGGGGEILKWVTEGQELEGIFRGFKEGKFGALGVLDTGEGRRVTFACHTVLDDRLREVKVGQLIRIVYEGYRTSGSGRQFKAFLVEVAEDDGTDFPLPNAPEGAEVEEGAPF